MSNIGILPQAALKCRVDKFLFSLIVNGKSKKGRNSVNILFNSLSSESNHLIIGP